MIEQVQYSQHSHSNQNMHEHQQLAPLSPVSQHSGYEQQIKKQVIISDTNFIKTIRNGRTPKHELACIYEQQPFIVQFRTLFPQSQNQAISEENYQIWDISANTNSGSAVSKQLYFQNIPYDCIQIRQGLWLISTKNMPARLYKLYHQSDTIMNLGSFGQKKKNSQQYLSPIQFAQNDTKIIGGGRRFLCEYDIEKIQISKMFKGVENKNISAITIMKNNDIIVGNFDGAVSILDDRQNLSTKGNWMRPHVDAVMSISASYTNQHIFCTSARKDGYNYIFDTRSYNQNKFIAQLYIPRQTNQRISSQFSKNSAHLYIGTQNSQIVRWQYDEHSLQEETKTEKYRIDCCNGSTINNVVEVDDGRVIFSAGKRMFQEYSDSDSDDEGRYNGKKESGKNMLGILKIKSSRNDNMKEQQQ